MTHTLQLLVLHLLLPLFLSDCSPNYEYTSSSSLCLPCKYNCLTCYDSAYCLQCMEEYYLDDTNSCQKCSFGCSVCTSNSTCTTCNSGLYLTNSGSCSACGTGIATCTIAVIQSCESTYFLLSTICAGCFSNCDTCSDFVTCSSCSLGYYLSADSSQCLACSANCLICTDSSTCTACAKGYTQNNGLCSLFNCASIDPFCIACTATQCLTCQQGEYLNSGNTCSQGASLLCLEATGTYHTTCQTSDYGCPAYAVVQTDSNANQLPVCLPYSATKTKEFIFLQYSSYSCSGTCSQSSSSSISYTTTQAYYMIYYYLNTRFYGTNPTRLLTITFLNHNGTNATSATTTIDVSKELSAFTDTDANCLNCGFSQKIVSGSVSLSQGEYPTQITLSDSNGQFQVIEAMFQHEICQVSHCSSCTSAIDCYACFSPYFLQLTSCVQYCDSGFYVYGKICYLQCPVGTYTESSTYSCSACVSPCLTCSDSTSCLTCVTGYFLEGSSCLTVCSSSYLFANTTSGHCQTCPNPCITCKYANSSISCLSCATGYRYNGSSCVFMCPWGEYGYFVNGTSECADCSSSCSSCYINSSICSSCNTGYLLLNTDCMAISSCPSSYYINSTYNLCLSCHYPCATCLYNSTFCTSCSRGSLYSNTCVNQCPSGYYSNYTISQNISCEACPSPCSYCISSSECVSCVSGYYLFQTSCLATCPTDYYSLDSNRTCVECIPPCKACLNSTACLSCTTGYLDNTACTLQCNASAYINSNFSCTVCPTPCINCYSATYCLLCQLPYFLFNNACIDKISCENITGYYPQYLPTSSNATHASCSACSFPCLSCLNNSVTCLSCQGSYLYVPNLFKCFSSCPTSYFLNTTQCSLCDSNCYKCDTTNTNCTACSAGMYLSPNSTCLSSCPSQYYPNDQTRSCSACSAPCLTCYNSYLCSSCATGILYSKQCINSCPSQTSYNSTSNTCVSCTNNCLTCQNSSSLCLSCASGYFLINQTCPSACPNQYYSDEFTRVCTACSVPCANCSSATSCLSCVSGYYYFNSLCVSSCDSSYYADNTTSSCLSCNITICLTCTASANHCITCNTNNGYYLSVSACVSTCPNNTYANQIAGTCDTCPFPCSTCLNYTYCYSCQTSYYLFNNRCFSQCPINYYSDNSSTCQPCSANCQVCSSLTVCLQCSSGYYVFNNTCLQTCPEAYYKGLQTNTNYDYCMPCQANCLSCSSSQYCLICNTTFIQFNGLCLTSCPILYYAVNTSNSYCGQCSTYCTSCINNTYCLNCIGSYLYNHSCLIACPAATYPSQGITCNPCKSPCSNCTGEFTCLTCLSGYIYFHEYCVLTCPSDVWYYPNNNTCDTSCPYNKYAQKMYCYIGKCGSSMVSLNGYCLQQCSSNYYVNSNQQCILCSQNQAICKNLFTADLQIVEVDVLTLVIYFNQKAALASMNDVVVAFVDVENNVIARNYSSYQITNYKIVIRYDHSPISLVNVTVSIPYVQSLESSQCISVNQYKKQLLAYGDYSLASDPSSIAYIPLILTLLLLIAIVINICNKSSHFSQVLDYVQIIAVTLYLDVQFPPILEHFLSGFRLSLFMVSSDMVDITPYTFSPPKFIFYNTDTSIFRNSLIILLVFLILLILFTVIIAVNAYNKERFPSWVRLIRYRLLNDLFSICLTPIMLFSLQILHQKPADIFITVLVVLIGMGYVLWISYKIVQVKKLSQLQGLLGEFEKTESKLGLMYIPFGYVRRITLTLGLGIAPFSPISTLTLLLVTTFLIMICVYFYEPFDNHYTDYVTIFMECSLTLYVICLIIFSLETLPVDMSFNLAAFVIFLVSFTFLLCVCWLVYLTVTDIRVKGCCPKAKQLQADENAKDDYSDSKSQKNRKKQAKERQQERLRKLGILPKESNKIEIIHENNEERIDDQSANDFLNRFQSRTDELFSHNIIQQQFKHWSDEQASIKSEDKAKEALPALLMKKSINNDES